MPDPDETTVQAALAALESGECKTYRAASLAFGITPSLLHRRANGVTSSRRKAHFKAQLLSPKQEQILFDWILNCHDCDHPVSHTQIREFVLLLSKSVGGPTDIGHNWVPRYLARHPQLKTKVGKQGGNRESMGGTTIAEPAE